MLFPARRRRIRIGLRALDLSGPAMVLGAIAPEGSPANCNFTVRGVKSPADDWVVRSGRVRGRVALLLRSTERQPAPARFFA